MATKRAEKMLKDSRERELDDEDGGSNPTDPSALEIERGRAAPKKKAGKKAAKKTGKKVGKKKATRR